ncbi:hypothetical protein SLS63_007798 [Diaporthe eres]|uniref:GAF domain-containing protein n=1 Tax=Diaporthe eres TaxID=83184 RepID=A0ABR1P4C1_DIAER
MVHADASTFAEGVSKEEALQQVLDQAAALFDGQRNWVCQTSQATHQLTCGVSGTRCFSAYAFAAAAAAAAAATRDVRILKKRVADENLANTASLLWHAYKSLPAPSKDVNWAGFYVLDPTSHGKSLILGPFMGQVACQTIDFGRGVCGTAAASKQTQLVPDVDAFPGHIACDGASKSEIVVPVTVEVVSPEEGGHVEKKVVGIIDIDCAEKNGFNETDKKYLEELAALLGRACDWPDSRLSMEDSHDVTQRGHRELVARDEA